MCHLFLARTQTDRGSWASEPWPFCSYSASLGSGATMGETEAGTLVFIVASTTNQVDGHFPLFSWSHSFFRHLCDFLLAFSFPGSPHNATHLLPPRQHPALGPSVPVPHQRSLPTTPPFSSGLTAGFSLSAGWPSSYFDPENLLL